MNEDVLTEFWNRLDEINVNIHQAEEKLERARVVLREFQGYIESIQELKPCNKE